MLFRVNEPEIVEAFEEEKAAEVVVSEEKVPIEVPVSAEERGETTPSPPVTVPTPASSRLVVAFPALQHRILILVDEKSQSDLLPSDALLLENILKATGHAAAETDILNFSYIPQADARTVLATKSTNYFISFGVPLIKLQLDLLLPPYTPKQIEGIWFLLAEPLSDIDADKARKKRLWLALKKMFAVA